MSGGKLVVKGHARHSLGEFMSGGRIVVEGSSGYAVGSMSLGGEIILKGPYRSYCRAGGATIYNRRGRALKTNSPVYDFVHERNERFIHSGVLRLMEVISLFSRVLRMQESDTS